MSRTTADPYQLNRLYSPMLSPGLSMGNPMLDIAGSFLAQQGVFPQVQGNNSVMDMMILRSRNMDQHYIMKRALASSQMMKRMGGINMESPVYQALYPFLALPDSFAWKAMSPLIGGNPVRAQMGLYADLGGQTLAAAGRMGNVSAADTDRMMDQLQGKFYRPSNFGRYVNSVEQPLRTLLGNDKFEQLNRNWSTDTIQSFEGAGVTGVNRDVGRLLESSLGKIRRVRENEDLTDTDRSLQLDKVKQQAKEAAQSFIATVSNREAQTKIADSFAKALEAPDSKVALKEFKTEWKEDIQDAFRMASRGVDVKTGRIPGEIDYDFTRGMKIEDITGAFGVAAQTGMLGRATGLNVAGFASSANSVLDAARGIFGRDLSGAELTKELSSLVGIGSVNMADPNEARKMEELLRNVKSMARVAGVSIESMRDVIDEGKNLAASNPNLPMGISGITSAKFAIDAMSDTTAGMGYMDPKLIRLMGGPVGMNSSMLAGRIQAQGEPVSRHLGALYFRAVQMGGENGQVAQRIKEYARTGDTTMVGQNKFIGQIASSLGMNPYQAMTFAGNNPMLSHAGLEMAPELGEAGQSSFMQTMLMETDIQLEGSMGLTEKLMSVALNPKYLSMSTEQAINEISASLPAVSRALIAKKVGPLLERAKQKSENSEGTMGLLEIQGLLGVSDRPGRMSWQRAVSMGYDAKFNQKFNPKAAAIHKQYAEARQQSAKAEGFYAKRLASLNAPILQRIFQQGIVGGEIEEGGMSTLKRLIGGGEDVKDFAALTKNLSEAQEMINALPEARYDEKGKLLDGPTKEQQAAVLRRLFPGVDLEGLAVAHNGIGLNQLRSLSTMQSSLDNVLTGLRGGAYDTYEALDQFLGVQTDIPAAIEAVSQLSGKTGKVSQSDLNRLIDTIQVGGKKDILRRAGQFGDGKKAGTPEQLVKAASDLRVIDPNQLLEGGFDPGKLMRHGFDTARLSLYDRKSGADVQRLIDEVSTLQTGDENARYSALKKLLGTEAIGDYEAILPHVNADNLSAIGNATTEEDRLRLARNAVGASGGKLGDSDIARVIRVAKGATAMGSLSGSKKLTSDDLVRLAVGDRFQQMQKAYTSGFKRYAGENVWNEQVANQDLPADYKGKLAQVRKEILEGQGDMGKLSEKMQDPAVRRRVEEIMRRGEKEGRLGHSMNTLTEAMSSYEARAKDLQAASPGQPGGGAAGMDFPGLIKAVTSLMTAVQELGNKVN